MPGLVGPATSGTGTRGLPLGHSSGSWSCEGDAEVRLWVLLGSICFLELQTTPVPYPTCPAAPLPLLPYLPHLLAVLLPYCYPPHNPHPNLFSCTSLRSWPAGCSPPPGSLPTPTSCCSSMLFVWVLCTHLSPLLGAKALGLGGACLPPVAAAPGLARGARWESQEMPVRTRHPRGSLTAVPSAARACLLKSLPTEFLYSKLSNTPGALGPCTTPLDHGPVGLLL